MCTLALAFQRFKKVPLVVAANRDEQYSRPSASPFVEQAELKILAGRDLLAGGSWLGVNEHGLMAAILNRRTDGDGPAADGTRSRGLLCMDMLRCVSAAAAARCAAQQVVSYNPFTLVVADRRNAFAAFNQGRRIRLRRLDAGLHVFSSAAAGAGGSPKADRAYEKFAQAIKGTIDKEESGAAWVRRIKHVLADHSLDDGAQGPGDAICVHRELSGTVSSSVIVFDQDKHHFEMFYCPGPPCRAEFESPIGLEVR